MQEIHDYIRNLFSKLNIGISQDGFDPDIPLPDVAINYSKDDSEFKTVIEILIPHLVIDEEYLCPVYTELSRLISNKWNCRTICEGTLYAANDSSYPGYSLIWDDNTAYLADDYGSDFFGEGGGDVKVIKRVDVDSEYNHSVLMTLFED